jgi:hypothetical protein
MLVRVIDAIMTITERDDQHEKGLVSNDSPFSLNKENGTRSATRSQVFSI